MSRYSIVMLLVVVLVVVFGTASVVIIGLVVLSSLEPTPRTVVVEDVTKANVVTLADDGDFQSGVTLHIFGEIDGKAVVYHSHEKTVLSGKVGWRYHHDWFEPTFELRYEPVSVRSGHLTIEYIFR